MTQTKYVIKMKMPTRPDLDYYYCGQSKSGLSSPIFDYRKPKAKRYTFIEEANRDLSILAVMTHDDTLTVAPIKCRA